MTTKTPASNNEDMRMTYDMISNKPMSASEWGANPNYLLSKTDAAGQSFEEQIRSDIEEQLIQEIQQKADDATLNPFNLSDIIPVFTEGVEATVKDNFTECFAPSPPDPWNWNFVLFMIWIFGFCVRYFFLLPIRIGFFIFGTLLYIIALIAVYPLPPNSLTTRKIHQKLLQYYASVWLLCWTAVIKYHGIPPVRRENQIYVSNHTSLIDWLVLSHYRPFASVGQKHPGFLGFLQNKVVGPLNNIWFERFENKDRNTVANRIREHIKDKNNPPLLIFPEGVCVNNEYCVMFKKGVFEMDDVEICPVAIRYNKLFSDPYWSSKDESFLTHVLRLMRSWCLVADVYFLESQKRQPNERSIDFTNRVKQMIVHKAKLVSVEWDGYLKYYSPSEKFREERQKIFARFLLDRWALKQQAMKKISSRNTLALSPSHSQTNLDEESAVVNHNNGNSTSPAGKLLAVPLAGGNHRSSPAANGVNGVDLMISNHDHDLPSVEKEPIATQATLRKRAQASAESE